DVDRRGGEASIGVLHHHEVAPGAEIADQVVLDPCLAAINTEEHARAVHHVEVAVATTDAVLVANADRIDHQGWWFADRVAHRTHASVRVGDGDTVTASTKSRCFHGAAARHVAAPLHRVTG